MREHHFVITIYTDNSPEIFDRACEKVEQTIPGLLKKALLIDVDGSTIQRYEKDEKEIIIYDDYDYGIVFARSDIDLHWIFGQSWKDELEQTAEKK